MLQAVRRRVAHLAAILALLMVAGIPINIARVAFGSQDESIVDTLILNGMMAIIAMIPWQVARSKRVSDSAVLKMGLALEIFFCLILSFFEQELMIHRWGHVPPHTWILPLIILFPLVIPTRPVRTLFVASLAALMSPLALLLNSLTPDIQPSLADYFEVTISPAIAATMALFCSKIVYNLNVEVSKARRLGSYQLETKLGTGGMGEVWQASHILLARPAAVKLIRPEVFQEFGSAKVHEAIARFEREAQVIASLRSSHTVQLFDFGVTGEGAPYYVMELIAGLDLDSFVRKHGPQPAERVVHLLAQACESLAEAHGAGLVHRDIKPANIMLTLDGVRPDFLKILDFGLVALKPEMRADEVELTKPLVITGTPAFMSPESITGDCPVDHRTDLYTLGCVAYWLLTGRQVFEDENPVMLLAAHAQNVPVPPSRVVESTIPGELEQLVMDSLAKAPGERPQTALEFRRRLMACPLEREWTDERALNWWQTHHPDIASSDWSAGNELSI
jgi:hypothetical protein